MNHFQPFHTHIALALQLIALVSGILLINKASSEGFFCKKTGKIAGGFVAVVSILSIICIGTLSIRRCCHRYEDQGMMPPSWRHPHIEMPRDLPPEPEEEVTPPKSSR